MSLAVSLRSELLKTKRTASFYLTVLAAVFGPLMSLLDIILDGVDDEHRNTLLNEMFTRRFQVTGLMVLPVFIILISTLLPQIEYRNNTWKQVLASPQKKSSVFFSKLVNIQILVLLFLGLTQLMMLITAVITHFAHPSLHLLQQQVDGKLVAMILVNSYVASLGMAAIQFWLGLKFRSFIAPIGIGVACWFVGTILVVQVKSSVVGYFPYSHAAYGNVPNFTNKFTSIGWISIVYAVVFLVIGFLDFRRKRMS